MPRRAGRHPWPREARAAGQRRRGRRQTAERAAGGRPGAGAGAEGARADTAAGHGRGTQSRRRPRPGHEEESGGRIRDRRPQPARGTGRGRKRFGGHAARPGRQRRAAPGGDRALAAEDAPAGARREGPGVGPPPARRRPRGGGRRGRPSSRHGPTAPTRARSSRGWVHAAQHLQPTSLLTIGPPVVSDSVHLHLSFAR